MKDTFYIKLQNAFIDIRHINTDGCYSRKVENKAVEILKSSAKTIEKKSSKQEKKLLLYCINTLLEIIKEENSQKIFDFADTVHNIPEIFIGKRNYFSFYYEIKSFRNKYGKNYFPNFRKLYPRFQKKLPKNFADYFSPDSDITFKLLHPIAYNIITIIACTVFLGPVFSYTAYVLFINPAPSEWTMILGVAGSFIFGIGLFNIVAAFVHQYLGHLVTIVCLTLGTAITFISLYLLYT